MFPFSEKFSLENNERGISFTMQHGCLVVSDVTCPLSLISFEDFQRCTNSDLQEISIGLPNGMEGEYYMYIQQDRQNPRVYYHNQRASNIAGQDIYSDVMIIEKEDDKKTLTEWRAFVNLRFPKMKEMEEAQKSRQELVDRCSIQ